MSALQGCSRTQRQRRELPWVAIHVRSTHGLPNKDGEYMSLSDADQQSFKVAGGEHPPPRPGVCGGGSGP